VAGYEAGSAYISVLPSLKGFQRQLKAELQGIEAEIRVPVKPQTDPTTKEKSRKDGEQAGGAFGDAFRERVKAALKSLPKAEITAESSDADRKIQEIRAQLQELSSKRVGVDISDDDALAKISELQAQLQAVGAEDSRVSVKIDTAAASAALDEIKAKIDRTLSPDPEPEGERAAGKWADGFKTRLSAALTALPEVKLTADSNAADTKIAGLRARLDSLRDKTIGVDVSEAKALAEIKAVQSELDRLAAKTPSVAVRVDAAEASAKLAAIRAEADALGGKRSTLNVSDGGSAGQTEAALGGVRLALVALSPMAVPIAASLIPAIAGIGVAAIAAVAALGVLKLGLSGIGEAYDAIGSAQTSEAENAGKNAQAIGDAERGVQDARESAADGAVSAAERVQQAQQSLADAERTSSEQVQNALQDQARAEQALANAQQQALRAQQALIDARRSAARNLQDLQMQSIQADLDQQSATLQLAQAQQALASVRANPFAAPGQVAQAQLQLEQAQLSQQRAGVAKERAGEDLSTAQDQGVSGAPGVMSAQDALTQATQGVGNAQQDVANAAQSVSDAQIEAAEKVANAEQGVTDAYRQQAIQARQGAESIVKAQEALATAASGNQDAVNRVNQAMAALSPAGQQFVLFLRSIKPQLDSIGLAAQQAMLPGIQAGIQALLPTLPAIRDVVAQIAGTVGLLAKNIGEALASPFWQGFLKTIGAEISPALELMAKIFGQFAEGGARLFVALLPLANQFGQAVESMSAQFLAWTKSPALGQFVDYVGRSVAVVWPLFASIGQAVLGLLPPIAELGLAMLKVAAPIVEDLLPPLVTLTQLVGNVLAQAFLAVVGPVTDLASLVGDALSQAFQACAPVLSAVLGAFKSLVDNGVVPLVRDGLRPLVTQALPPILSLIPVLSPIIQAIGDTFAAILPPIMQVVSTLVSALVPVIQALVPILKPILETIGDIVTAVFGGIVVPMFTGILIPAIQIVANVILWLVNTIVVPGMKLLGEGIQFAYDNWIKPCFDALMGAVRNVASTFSDGVGWIGTAWEGLKKVVGTPVKFVIDYIYNDGIVWLWNHVADLIGAGHLNPIDTSGIPHFAGGGILAGYAPGSDVVPALLSPGEGVLVPEAVRMLGPATVLALNASASGRTPASGAGVARFADGGIVGDILGFVSGATSDVVKFLTDPIGSIKAALGNTQWVDMLAHLPATLLDKAGSWIWDKLTSIGNWFGGGGTAAGSPQLDAWIAQAMGIAGVPATWALGLHTLIMRESGGNPKAINLTDSNAQRGDPSRGLMQTIMSTFEAYRDPSLPNDIFDPVANIVAGIHYIQRAYGSIADVQQANPNLPPKGYDAGGILPPGLSTVLNGTGQPEAILTSAQFSALAAAPSFPPDGWEITGALTVDGMDARIDGRINRAEQRTGTAIAQRSRL
jgi:phage-related protein